MAGNFLLKKSPGSGWKDPGWEARLQGAYSFVGIFTAPCAEPHLPPLPPVCTGTIAFLWHCQHCRKTSEGLVVEGGALEAEPGSHQIQR